MSDSREPKAASRGSASPSSKVNQRLLIAGDEYVKAETIADEIGVGVQKVRDLIKDGDLAAFKVGKEYLIPAESYRAYMDRRSAEAELWADVKRKRRRDPSAVWDLAMCVGCGEQKVVCTREDRQEGWFVLCPACQGREGQTMYEGEREVYFSFRTDRLAWRRAMDITTDEANRAHQERHNAPGTFMVSACRTCGCPHKIDASTAYLVEEGDVPGDEADFACTHPKPWSQ
jgi:excisionase family DNA binding protein